MSVVETWLEVTGRERAVWCDGRPWRLVLIGNNGSTAYESQDGLAGEYMHATMEHGDPTMPTAALPGTPAIITHYRGDDRVERDFRGAPVVWPNPDRATLLRRIPWNPEPATVWLVAGGGNMGGDVDATGASVVDGMLYIAVGDDESWIVSPAFTDPDDAAAWARSRGWVAADATLEID